MFFGFPAEAWIIMAVEFTERAAYYGVAFMLMTYCTTMLRWSPSVGNAVVNALYAVAPASACVSSGLSDGHWGRPFSLVVFIVLYAVGLGMIALSSYPFFYHEFPIGATTGSIVFFAIGMAFFALGYGGMKVCTNPLMADSVTEVYKNDEQRRLSTLSQLFRWIYWVTNCGSLVGIFVPPLLRQLEKRRIVIGTVAHTTGYYYGFTMSAVLCAIGLIMFSIMYRRFKKNEPSPTFVLARILFRAVRVRWRFATGQICDDAFLNAHRCELIDFAVYRDTPARRGGGALDSSNLSESLCPSGEGKSVNVGETKSEREKLKQQSHIKSGEESEVTEGDKLLDAVRNGIYVSDANIFDLNDITAAGWIADAKVTVAVCRAFVAMPIYWLITNRFSTDMVLQAEAMNLPDFVPPEVFNNINTIALLVSLALFDRVIFPFLYPDRKPPMRGRVATGFALMIISVVWCGFVQFFVDRRGTYDDAGKYIVHPGESMVAVGWLVLPYMLQGIASALVDTTVMEVAYVSAPASMKGAVMALYLLASSVSGFLGLALSPLFKPTNAMIVFFSLGAALTVVMIIFYFLNPHAVVAHIPSNNDGARELTSIFEADVVVPTSIEHHSGQEIQYLLSEHGMPRSVPPRQYGGTPPNSNNSSNQAPT